MTMQFRGLHEAVQREDIEAVHAFLDEGVDINARDETYKWTSLQLAAYLRQVKAACVLFERGACQTISQEDYDSALGFAAASRNATFVRLFLEKGTHRLTAENLSSALSQAAWFSSYETLQPLVEHGAVVTATHLFTAASAHVYSDTTSSEHHAKTVEFILNHGIDIND